MAFFDIDTLSNAMNLHVQILDDRANVWPANSVVVSFLTVQEKAVSKMK
jgi:hypothetical protein